MCVKMMSTPKYHCELAGEGIEYAWGFIKSRYRCILPLSQKKYLDQFRASLTCVLSLCNVSKERIRMYFIIFMSAMMRHALTATSCQDYSRGSSWRKLKKW